MAESPPPRVPTLPSVARPQGSPTSDADRQAYHSASGSSLVARLLGVARRAAHRLLGDGRPLRLVHRAGHFHSPIPSREDALSNREVVSPESPAALPGIDLNASGQLALLRELCRFYADLPFADGPRPGLRYHYQNAYYGYSDAILLAALLRHFRPRSVIEVGSGFSSAVMLDTDELFLGGATAFTFIDPHPRRLLRLMKAEDRARVQVLRTRVQEVPLALFEALQPGDVLFVDSSHVSKVGSDVNHLLFAVLPRLRPGVLVHFHDVYYPFDYPREHVLAGFAWNEAYLLRAFLQYNRAFEVLLFNTWLETFHAEEVYGPMPLCRLNPGGSLWLRRL